MTVATCTEHIHIFFMYHLGCVCVCVCVCVFVQVEHVLFPELGGHVLELSSMGMEEAPVTLAREEALVRLRANLPGPHKYAPLDHVDTVSRCVHFPGTWLLFTSNTKSYWMAKHRGMYRPSYSQMPS